MQRRIGLDPLLGSLRRAARQVRAVAPRPHVVVASAVALTFAVGTATAATTAAEHAGAHPQPLAAAAALPRPAAPGPAASVPAAAGTASTAAAVTTASGSVAPLRRLRDADFLLRFPHRIRSADLATVRGVRGVTGVDIVDYGRLTVDGHPATSLGVDPSTFRAFTPKLSAQSDPLWASVARGELTASFGMGHDANLPLGRFVTVRGSRTMPLRLGAFATTLPGVDAIVNRLAGAELGLPADNAMVVSATETDLTGVRDALRAVLPRGASVQMLRQVVVIRDAGEYLTRTQLDTALRSALSRVGMPYVWGAYGNNAFDCSGLVGWAYAQAGIELPRTSQQQWFAGPHVPLADARPGDLLFWNYDPADPADIDHVAMYIGNGEMVVAPHTGVDVQVSYIPMAHFMGVVRVDPALAAQVGGPRFVISNHHLYVG